MSESSRSIPLRPVTAFDTDVARYETLPLEEVQEELRKAGINPAATIAAVRQLVEDSLTSAQTPSPSHGGSRSRRSLTPAAHHEDDGGDTC
jgi:hypothetical protein